MIGINNVGNTCYCNSAIQVLYSVEPFRNAIREIKNSDNVIVNHLKEIFDNLAAKKVDKKGAGDIVLDIGFNVGTMYDSSEAIKRILERIVNVNLLKCFNYTVPNPEEKEINIPIITENILFVKEIFDSNSFITTVELYKIIEYPDYFLIDLNTAGTLDKAYYDEKDKQKVEEYLNLYRPQIPETFEIDGVTFKLISFAVRTGEHYYAYVRNSSDEWYEISDLYVTKRNPAGILSNKQNGRPSLLCYVRTSKRYNSNMREPPKKNDKCNATKILGTYFDVSRMLKGIKNFLINYKEQIEINEWLPMVFSYEAVHFESGNMYLRKTEECPEISEDSKKLSFYKLLKFLENNIFNLYMACNDYEKVVYFHDFLLNPYLATASYDDYKKMIENFII
jgi:hypothetical protein